MDTFAAACIAACLLGLAGICAAILGARSERRLNEYTDAELAERAGWSE